MDQRLRLKFPDAATNPLASLGLPAGELVVCLLGGGQDGAALAEAFASAPLPPNTNGIILTGPFMPADVQARLMHAAKLQSRMRVIEFLPEPAVLVNAADRIIAMGGYNTVCEVLSFEKPALIVPRTRPRREQWIRAQRLAALGLIDVLDPDELSPAALGNWMKSQIRPRARARD